MTYLQFLLLFLGPPLLALWWPRRGGARGARVRLSALALPLIALVYTTPWDNYLVASGVWTYGADRVLGTIGWVPVEEYLFFLLQPLLALGWLLHVGLHREDVPRRAPLGAALLLLGAFAGALLLRVESARYLALIVAWAAPVLAGLWYFTGDVLARRSRRYALAVGVPTLYLWAADWIAMCFGIWHITERYATGLGLPGLPLEEMLFFLVTNLLSVHGALLLLEPARLLRSRR